MKRVTVLISGRGSNLVALHEASLDPAFGGAITAVISNRPEAKGLEFARARAIAATVVDHKAFASREAFDAAIGDAIDASEPDLVVLAGFMRVMGAALVERFEGRMINVHPSLLPSYPGLHTHRRALADGVRIHGCTVHFVTRNVDIGPIIAQAAVPVLAGDDETRLAARVLVQEHRLLPDAVRQFCAGRLGLHAGRLKMQDGGMAEGALLVPPVGR